MAYKVIKRFTDLQDNYHIYDVGDVFPREGASVSNVRIAQLASSNNRQRTPLIVEDECLDSATPAQPEAVEQETPPEIEGEQDVPLEMKTEAEQPKKRKKKEE